MSRPVADVAARVASGVGAAEERRRLPQPSFFVRRYRNPMLLGLSILGPVVLGWLILVVGQKQGTVGFDSYAYWSVNPWHPYEAPLGTVTSFPYTPAAALAFAPAHSLAFSYFYLLWAGFLGAVLVWLTGRYTLVWLVFLPVPLELYHANIHLLFAAMCVLGLRYPALWSIGLLTKVTPGIGLLWFVARREWRELAIAVGVTAALAAASFVAAPSAWPEYVGYLRDSLGGPARNGEAYLWLVPPLWLRLLAAAALVWWGARGDRRWTLPVAVAASLPVLWITGLAVLTAIPRLRRPASPERPPVATSAAAAPAASA